MLGGLPPIIDRQARVLILGSFPSEASLSARHYYAHRRNQFWRLLAAILGQPLPELDYAAKQAAVRAAGLAVWDVYAACRREGSLDSAIRDGEENDFSRLADLAPHLARVCFNGRTAARFERRLADLGYEVVVLPSSSPANAGWSFQRKLDRWQEALGAALIRAGDVAA
jgi:hypoxanthine-DNA glycosylase